MPKVYYCNNLIGLEECGESNPDNFYTGRYNKCKRCRNEMVKACNKAIRENKDNERPITLSSLNEELTKLKLETQQLKNNLSAIGEFLETKFKIKFDLNG